MAMLRSRGAYRLLLLLSVLTAAPSLALADAPAGPPPPEGAVQMKADPVAGDFRLVPGSTNVWETAPFTVQGNSPWRHWSVVCEVSGLRSVQTGKTISPDRIELVAPQLAPGLNLKQPQAVLVGGIGTKVGPSGTASFALRVRTDWQDPPGLYTGTIRFSTLAAP